MLSVTTYDVELVGQFGGITSAVALQGRYAYIGVSRQLLILDISDPAQLFVVGRSGFLPDDVVRGLVVVGNLAYVAGGNVGLRIVDVSNPAAPREVGAFDTPGFALSLAVEGDLAYIADREAGLRIVDVSNPAAPRQVGDYDTSGSVWKVAVAGRLIYVADQEGGLVILRYTAPTPLCLPVILRGHTLLPTQQQGVTPSPTLPTEE